MIVVQNGGCVGFRDAKAQVLACLEGGAVLHEQRGDIDIKNLLATGQVSLDDVAVIIGRSRGSQYSSSPHHVIDDVKSTLSKLGMVAKIGTSSGISLSPTAYLLVCITKVAV
jgi:hypothetical protein